MAYQNNPLTHAKSSDAASSGVRQRLTTTEELLERAGVTPDRVLDLLREVIEADRIGTARRLLADAPRRFPDDPKIRTARRVFAESEATPNLFVQPTAGAEIEWLRQPPDDARGKWVALIGSKLVGIADSAEELFASLRSERFEQFPVVQYIAP